MSVKNEEMINMIIRRYIKKIISILFDEKNKINKKTSTIGGLILIAAIAAIFNIKNINEFINYFFENTKEQTKNSNKYISSEKQDYKYLLKKYKTIADSKAIVSMNTLVADFPWLEKEINKFPEVWNDNHEYVPVFQEIKPFSDLNGDYVPELISIGFGGQSNIFYINYKHQKVDKIGYVNFDADPKDVIVQSMYINGWHPIKFTYYGMYGNGATYYQVFKKGDYREVAAVKGKNDINTTYFSAEESASIEKKLKKITSLF